MSSYRSGIYPNKFWEHAYRATYFLSQFLLIPGCLSLFAVDVSSLSEVGGEFVVDVWASMFLLGAILRLFEIASPNNALANSGRILVITCMGVAGIATLVITFSPVLLSGVKLGAQGVVTGTGLFPISYSLYLLAKYIESTKALPPQGFERDVVKVLQERVDRETEGEGGEWKAY